MMYFKEVRFSLPKESKANIFVFRKLHSYVVLLLIGAIHMEYLPHWLYILPSSFLIIFSLLIFMVLWYCIFIIRIFSKEPTEPVVYNVNAVFELIGPVAVCCALWYIGWTWTLMFYGTSVVCLTSFIVALFVRRYHDKLGRKNN